MYEKSNSKLWRFIFESFLAFRELLFEQAIHSHFFREVFLARGGVPAAQAEKGLAYQMKNHFDHVDGRFAARVDPFAFYSGMFDCDRMVLLSQWVKINERNLSKLM